MISTILRRTLAFSMLAGLLAWTGCRTAQVLPPAPVPLGTVNDAIWQNQEHNAEASDFVVHVHEFAEADGFRLNTDGEDHVKEIAARLQYGGEFPVIVQRSRNSVSPDDEYGYPIHTNPALDMQRREVVVQTLVAMGVSDADQRVVVAPTLTPGYEAFEAEGAYQTIRRQGLFGFSNGTFGFGSGGFGGFGF